MKTLRLAAIRKLILFGGGPLMLEFSLWARDKYECVLITAPRQAEEIIPGSDISFAKAIAMAGLQICVLDEINGNFWLKEQIDDATLGLGFGEAWNFGSELVELFDGRLFDFMGIPLPRYRGGAHYTWAILRGETEWGCHLQVINEKTVQGWFDSGELVASHQYQLDKGLNSPGDYFTFCMTKELEFLEEFFSRIKSGGSFELLDIDEEKSLFFPRLNTKNNGWINWDWRGEEIVQFINAFSDPYMGASTYVDGQRVFLKNARLDSNESGFHPYQSGLIVRITGRGIGVATTAGFVYIEEVENEDGDRFNNCLLVGQRFTTPQTTIVSSENYKPDYRPSGDANNGEPPITSGIEIDGKRIRLRSVTLDDCTMTYVGWLQDEQVNQYLETRWIVQTLDTVKAFVKSMIGSSMNELLAIIDKSTGAHIGNVKLGNVNLKHKCADVGYFIGEKTFWKKGYGLEALSLVTEYALNDLELEYVYAGVYESNIASQRLLEKAGYKQQGRLRKQLVNAQGQREDKLWYGILKFD